MVGRIVQGVDEGGYPEDVREQDEFLANVGAFLSGSGQELDRVHPFFCRGPTRNMSA